MLLSFHVAFLFILCSFYRTLRFLSRADVNDVPLLINNPNASIAENSGIGTTVVVLSRCVFEMLLVVRTVRD